MEDVIFHGSQSDKTCNMAEVEMIIANENSILPLDYNEISIIRRLYRSGESEYLINRKPSRLKDIQLLFMDTGVGKSTYSVIEQGKIDKILSKNPQDRRYIFEEAAGLSKYRDRKKEYERKILKTKENLRRVNDITSELEKQHGQLKQQAKKATLYFDLQEKLKTAEMDMLLYRLLQLKKKKKGQEERLFTIHAQIENTQKEMQGQKSKVQEMQAQISLEEKDIRENEKKKIEIDERINSYRNESQSLEERIEEAKDHLQIRQHEVKDFQKEKKELSDKIAEVTEEIKVKKTLKEKNQKELHEIKKEIVAFEHKQKSDYKEVATSKRRLEEIKEESSRLNKEHFVVVEKLLKEIDELKERLSKEKSEQAINRKELSKLFQKLKGLLKELAPFETEEALRRGVEEIARFPAKDIKESYRDILTRSFEVRKLNKDLESRLKKMVGEDDPFYSIIFSAEGTYAQKEKIDQALKILQAESRRCEENIRALEKNIAHGQKEESKAKRKLAEIEIAMAALSQTINMNIRIREEKIANTNELETRFQAVKQNTRRQESSIEKLEKEKKKSYGQSVQLEKEGGAIDKHLARSSKHLQTQRAKQRRSQDKMDSLVAQLEGQTQKRSEIILHEKLLEKDIEALYEKAMSEYSEDLKTTEKQGHRREFNPEKMKRTMEALQGQLKAIGGNVNPLAQSEYESLDERLKEIKGQSRDIEESMADLVQVVSEIDVNSKKIFLSTFDTIKKNFDLVFRQLFEGGTGKIELVDEDDPLVSGIDVFLQPPGKKFQSINLFSGGEKSLISIALMFSIFLVKPSPICLLDEVDAALDIHNIVRLAKLLDEFKNRTQIIIVTHNEKTSSIIDYAYGVTMKNGISKTLSLALH